MATVTRPTLTPLGRVLLGIPASPPTTRLQELPLVVVFHRPPVELGSTRPTLPRPTKRRSGSNGSMIRSVTEARLVPAATPTIVEGIKTSVQVSPPSVDLYTPGPPTAPWATPA